MSRSHFHLIVIAVAKPASSAVTIHVALRSPTLSSAPPPFSPSKSKCDAPVIVPRVEPRERFGRLQAEEGVAVLDGVDEGEGRDDDLPWSEAGEDTV
jgi:hypothetical protein